MVDRLKERQGLNRMLVSILVLGSLWGMSEVILGGSLRASGFPYRSGLLTGIGMALMGVALVTTRKPLLPIGIGVVAVLVNLLVVPILHVSAMCKANSLLALGIEAGSLSLVGVMLTRKSGGSVYARMGGGAAAALIASAGFYFVGIHAVPCAYLLSFGTPASFIVKEGITWAAFSAILLPVGCLVGERLAMKPLRLLSGRPAYYATAAIIVVVAWSASALAIAAGF